MGVTAYDLLTVTRIVPILSGQTDMQSGCHTNLHVSTIYGKCKF